LIRISYNLLDVLYLELNFTWSSLSSRICNGCLKHAQNSQIMNYMSRVRILPGRCGTVAHLVIERAAAVVGEGLRSSMSRSILQMERGARGVERSSGALEWAKMKICSASLLRAWLVRRILQLTILLFVRLKRINIASSGRRRRIAQRNTPVPNSSSHHHRR
jgi:hypothetical protein